MNRRRAIRTTLFVTFLAAPTLFAVAWTCLPAARAAWATLSMSPVALSAADWTDPRRLLDARRTVQRHFLAHAVYIPMEDIVAPVQGEEQAPGSVSLLMQKACGPGKLYVWIPFKFYLPVTGEKVIEWCWKPQTKGA